MSYAFPIIVCLFMDEIPSGTTSYDCNTILLQGKRLVSATVRAATMSAAETATV